MCPVCEATLSQLRGILLNKGGSVQQLQTREWGFAHRDRVQRGAASGQQRSVKQSVDPSPLPFATLKRPRQFAADHQHRPLVVNAPGGGPFSALSNVLSTRAKVLELSAQPTATGLHRRVGPEDRTWQLAIVIRPL